MKTVLAALAISCAAVASSGATEAPLVLRGGEKAGAVEATRGEASAPSVEAAPVRKVRVVLASPYGN